jgi:SAM-dependent methyltransferase
VRRVDEKTIEGFWSDHPCGDAQVGGLNERYLGNYEQFFREYDRFRYNVEGHIPACLDRLSVRGRDLLEIGIGEGAEAEQLIRRGAIYSAMDITGEAVNRTTARLRIRQLPYARVERASVLSIPWPDKSFDVVFSHGVLHHVPEIRRTQQEIHRVLRPRGELVIMVYSRKSLNYLIAISVIRRFALLALYPLRSSIRSGRLAQHLLNAESHGLWSYLSMKQFIHKNTDGPENPYSKVYDLRSVRRDFPDFEVVDSWKAFMHAPPLPVHGFPGASVLGWHLWVRLRPR